MILALTEKRIWFFFHIFTSKFWNYLPSSSLIFSYGTDFYPTNVVFHNPLENNCTCYQTSWYIEWPEDPVTMYNYSIHVHAIIMTKQINEDYDDDDDKY